VSIFFAHAVVDPGAMMVIGCYTFFALMAVPGSIWLIDHANPTISTVSFLFVLALGEPKMLQILIILHNILIFSIFIIRNSCRWHSHYLS
jgi:hypothetical protein